jgi:uncharacterized protein (DUF362 family)
MECELKQPVPESTTSRRQFLRLTAAGLLTMSLPWSRKARPVYRVGVGRNADAYPATLRAIGASGAWSPAAVAGRTVLIKPNLLQGVSPQTGIVTDAQAVRAVVDLCLAAGALEIKIIEGHPGGTNFAACGYGFLQNYGGAGRVSLVNLDEEPYGLATVNGGLAYKQIYLPELVLAPNTYLISVGKLKCHAEALATLATKNVFGLPPLLFYKPPTENGRFGMHYRGVNQATVDINLARPIDFAVVEGIWGMEGYGPAGGTPVRMNMVAAGSNSVAVDRVCLEAMAIPQGWVQHLTYGAEVGLGPATMEDVEVAGDAITPQPFSVPVVPPHVTYPRLNRPAFSPHAGERVTGTYWIGRPCRQRVDVIQTSDHTPVVTHVRLLQDWINVAGGDTPVEWDGRDDQGNVVGPGIYTIRVEADGNQRARNAFATAWVEVLAPRAVRQVFLPFVRR